MLRWGQIIIIINACSFGEPSSQWEAVDTILIAGDKTMWRDNSGKGI